MKYEPIEGEEWREIPGWEGFYSVSNLGRVKSNKRRDPSVYQVKERILSETRHPNCGHKMVQLNKHGKSKTRWVHRLVLLAFVGPPPSDASYQCRHLDGNASNNRIENLCYGTAKENYDDTVRHGRAFCVPGGPWPFPHNGGIPQKLSNEQVREILASPHIKGVTLAGAYGVSETTICRIRNGTRRANIITPS